MKECSGDLHFVGLPYPRTCAKCSLGPCLRPRAPVDYWPATPDGIVTDECRCSSCESGCLPPNCSNGKCRSTGVCVDSLPAPDDLPNDWSNGNNIVPLPLIDSPSIAPSLPDRLVIGFMGRAGSGKSTAAQILIGEFGFERGKFAGALKAMLRTFLSYRGVDPVMIERLIEGDLKEPSCVEFGGRSPRHAMQTLGTEWGRECIDFNLWVDTEMDAKAHVPRLVFDDIRFPNEVSAIRQAGGIVVKVDRPGMDASTAAGHVSEESIEQLSYDLVITNDSTIDEFRARLVVALGNLGKSTQPVAII